MTTISEIREDHFDGGGNLTRGSRVNSDALLEELLNQAKVDINNLEIGVAPANTFYVDKMSLSSAENGSWASPFKTIQAAIDHVETLAVTPLFNSPATIAIMPGKYAENLVISKDDLGITFAGNCSSAHCNILISPATGVGLTIHNATPVSLATYLSTGVYSDLVNAGGQGPSRVTLQDVIVSGRDGILALGVKGDDTIDTTNFLNQSLMIYHSQLGASSGYSLFVKNSGSILFENSKISSKPVDLHEVGIIISWDTTFEIDFSVEYDPADPDGWSKTSSYGAHMMRSSHAYLWGTPNLTVGIGVTWKPQNCIVGGNVIVNDTGEVDADDLTIKGNLDVNGASGDVSALGIAIGGNLTMTVGKTATLNAPHIAGAVTLDNGAGAVVLNGGEYMGALTDVGVRLTRNVGS